MRRIALVIGVIPAHHRCLEAHHHIGVVGVVLTAVNVFKQSALLQRFSARAGALGDLPLIFLQLLKRHTTDARGDTREGTVHQFTIKAHGLEQLCTSIGVHGRDAHFGHNLEQALVNALAEILLTCRGISQQLAPCQQILNHAVCKVGVDGGRTEAEQAGEVVGVTRAARLHHQITVRAQTDADQMVMDGTSGQQAVYRDTGITDIAVREHHNTEALADGGLGTRAQRLKRLPKRMTFGRLISSIEYRAAKSVLSQIDNGAKLALRQHRRG